MWETMLRLARDRKAATAVEYGLIVALVIVAIMGALVLFGSRAVGMWNNVATIVAST